MPSVRANYLGLISKSHLNTSTVSATLSFSSMCVQQTQILNWQEWVCFSIGVLLHCSCCLTSFCSCFKNPAVHWVNNRDKASFVPLRVLFTENKNNWILLFFFYYLCLTWLGLSWAILGHHLLDLVSTCLVWFLPSGSRNWILATEARSAADTCSVHCAACAVLL